MGRLVILAGGGVLPHIGMREAIEAGEDPLFFGLIESEFEPNIYESRTSKIHITQVSKLFKKLHEVGADRLLMLGKVKKELLYQNLKFDLKALSLLAKTTTRHDYPIFAVLADELSKNGVEVVSQKLFLKSLLLPSGKYTKFKISSDLWGNVIFGMQFARNMAELEIGQMVVVQDKCVIAVEAVEGTDACIRRAGSLSKNKEELVVCKAGKKKQDPRFDLPTVGPETILTIKESGGKVLALEEGSCLMISPKETIALAEKEKIHILVLSPGNWNAQPKTTKLL